LKKLAALVFATLIIVSALVITFIQPVSATSNENVPVTLSSVFSVDNSNGLIVAIGGIIAVAMFLLVILLNVLKKRKKKMQE
jgi:hypothetical protein